MKVSLMLTFCCFTSTVNAQKSGPIKKLRPDVPFYCETCPGTVAFRCSKNYFRRCSKTYSRIDILKRKKHKLKWYVVFSLLYREEREAGKVYSFPVTDTLKSKHADCYESLIFNFSDEIGTERMGGESEPNQFPWTLMKKQRDASNEVIYFYNVGYLVPSSSAYLDCIAFDKNMNLKAVVYDTEYEVPGKTGDSTIVFSVDLRNNYRKSIHLISSNWGHAQLGSNEKIEA